jgi:hypothetical protein
MAIFTTRITDENGSPVVWIDRDGSICIKQPHAPGMEGTSWGSVEEAQAWADAHVLLLQDAENKTEAARLKAIAKEEEFEAKADADSARLVEVHAMLTQLLANQATTA